VSDVFKSIIAASASPAWSPENSLTHLGLRLGSLDEGPLPPLAGERLELALRALLEREAPEPKLVSEVFKRVIAASSGSSSDRIWNFLGLRLGSRDEGPLPPLTGEQLEDVSFAHPVVAARAGVVEQDSSSSASSGGRRCCWGSGGRGRNAPPPPPRSELNREGEDDEAAPDPDPAVDAAAAADSSAEAES